MPSAKRKSGLGKGLSALMTEAQTETGQTAQEQTLPITSIIPNPNQPRTHFNETELRELSESIEKHGVLQPLLVRHKGDHYEIIAGERRYKAARMAGLVSVPAIISNLSDQASDDDDLPSSSNLNESEGLFDEC